MVYCYGVAVMNRRTTFALDDSTVFRLRHLAAVWRVSQAEVVRRAIEQADRDASSSGPDPLELLGDYQRAAFLDPQTADAYLDEVAENRAEWGRQP